MILLMVMMMVMFYIECIDYNVGADASDGRNKYREVVLAYDFNNLVYIPLELLLLLTTTMYHNSMNVR